MAWALRDGDAVSLAEYAERAYLDYSMYVVLDRALPFVGDGLKPVHRRCLFGMWEQNNLHNKPYKKSARIVGDVLGKYHPHGEGSVYDSIVRMAQDFSMRYPLVDGQGNFGSIDGDNAAAMRYTEIRLTRLAAELIGDDIEKETVDWVPNYDGSLLEPTVLPSKFPNLLVNGSSGIAVGMATNIPPHNLGEVIDATIELIRHPDATLGQLMKKLPGPDFPTAGFIHGATGIRDAYQTGRGIVQVRIDVVGDALGRAGEQRACVGENLAGELRVLLYEARGVAVVETEQERALGHQQPDRVVNRINVCHQIVRDDEVDLLTHAETFDLLIINAFGSDAQKSEILPKILKGQMHFSIGYSEPEAGTDLSSLKLAARRDGAHPRVRPRGRARLHGAGRQGDHGAGQQGAGQPPVVPSQGHAVAAGAYEEGGGECRDDQAADRRRHGPSQLLPRAA